MADDPFAGYTPPSQKQGADPFAGYSAPAPSGNAIWDLLTRPVAQSEGVGQAAKDYGRAIFDTGTFGYGNDIQAALSGNTPEQERAETAAAHQRLGGMDYAANAVGYAPTASLGIAGRLGGGVLGTAAEGALASGVGAAGHGEDVGNVAGSALAGAAGGGVLGGLSKYIINPVAGGIANKFDGGAAANPAADITSAAQDAKTAAYDKLKDTMYNPADVMSGLQNAGKELSLNDPGGDLARAAPRSMAELTKLGNQVQTSPTTTAHGILSSIQNLDGIQGPMGGGENAVAPVIQKHLQNILDNVDPVATTSTGATADLAAATAANKTYKNAQGLQQAAESLKGFGQSPASWAQNTAESFYNDPSSPEYKALSKIATAAGGAPAGQTAYSASHIAHPLVEGGLMAGLGAPAGAVLAPAVMYGAVKPSLGAALGRMQKSGTTAAINAAYPALTGQAIKPPGAPDVSQALRALLFGSAASGFQ
jgi:hypothetical protein